MAQAEADGYTTAFFVIGVPLVGPETGIPAPTSNPFEPVGKFLTCPIVIAAPGDAPHDHMTALPAHAAANDVVPGHFGAVPIRRRVTRAPAERTGFRCVAIDAPDCNAPDGAMLRSSRRRCSWSRHGSTT